MQKITASDPTAHSSDLQKENIEKLTQLFPELLDDGLVNVDALKGLVGDQTVTDADERYGLNWHGKRAAQKLALSPSTGTLRPYPDESRDWDTTKNLMIEGDNLEVLKLLQKSYSKAFKMVYIDPPYNTGSDFIYPDDFSNSIDSYLQITGQLDDSGQKTTTNSESSGRFHTNWLNMIYPRLKLAHRLLDQDGLFVASIGDTELANFTLLLDSIFGSENYLNTIAVKAKLAAGASGGGEDKRLKKSVEYLLVYAKSLPDLDGFSQCYTEQPLMEVIAEMKSAGQSWKYTSILVDHGVREKLMTVPDGDGNPIDIFLHKEIKRMSLREACKEEGISEEEAYTKYLSLLFSDTNAQTSIRTRVIDGAGPLDEGCMYSTQYVPKTGKDKGVKVTHYYISNTVRRVIWLKDVASLKNGQVIKRERTGTVWEDLNYNNVGKEGGVQFPNGKKPLELLSRILSLISSPNGKVLDFFAGSGSMAHAIFIENSVNNRSFSSVSVQLPEQLNRKKKDDKWAVEFCSNLGKPLVISELTKERLRRAADEVKDKNPLFSGDLGFRVFKLDSTNIREWDPNREDLAESLEESVQHLKTDRSEEDILFELLLKLGLDLCVPIEARSIGDHEVHSIGAGSLIVCLSKEIPEDDVERLALGITKWHSEQNPAGDSTAVFRDSAFENESAKSNLTAILEQHNIPTVRSI